MKTNSKTCFILAVTFMLLSLMWFWAENIPMGIIWLTVGMIDLIIGIIIRSKAKKER